MIEEVYTKSMMKFQKKELVAYLWKIKGKTKALRKEFEQVVDVKTYREHDGVSQCGLQSAYFDFKKAIAVYLGEKIQ